MRIEKSQNWITLIVFAIVLSCCSSCFISRKMDVYVAEQYNNQIPKQDRKKKADITVNSVFQPDKAISRTVKKTSHFLPLLLYWQYDYRHTCTLNPAIAVSIFSNTVNSVSAKGLSQKLNGQHLELTVEQVPSAFALVDKEHMLIFLFSWNKLYVEPDFKDLIVSYKLFQNDNTIKTGRITIKNSEQNRGIRFAQSWKSSTSEYLTSYNANITTMSKSFVNKLMEEL